MRVEGTTSDARRRSTTAQPGAVGRPAVREVDRKMHGAVVGQGIHDSTGTALRGRSLQAGRALLRFWPKRWLLDVTDLRSAVWPYALRLASGAGRATANAVTMSAGGRVPSPTRAGPSKRSSSGHVSCQWEALDGATTCVSVHPLGSDRMEQPTRSIIHRVGRHRASIVLDNGCDFRSILPNGSASFPRPDADRLSSCH